VKNERLCGQALCMPRCASHLGSICSVAVHIRSVLGHAYPLRGGVPTSMVYTRYTRPPRLRLDHCTIAPSVHDGDTLSGHAEQAVDTEVCWSEHLKILQHAQRKEDAAQTEHGILPCINRSGSTYSVAVGSVLRRSFPPT
jgi:hypothetical protein